MSWSEQDVRELVEAAHNLSDFMKKYAGAEGALTISADNPFTANGYADKYIALDGALARFTEASDGK